MTKLTLPSLPYAQSEPATDAPTNCAESTGSVSDHAPLQVGSTWSRTHHRTLPGVMIPWAMIVAHDEQAKRNHAGQDLHRLWQRHGVSACEALAILDDRPWRAMDIDEAQSEIIRRVEAWLSQNNKISNGGTPAK